MSGKVVGLIGCLSLLMTMGLSSCSSSSVRTRVNRSEPISSPCRSSQLNVSDKFGVVALGHSSVIILFKNTSTTTCTLSGYPEVAALGSANHQPTQAVQTPNGYLGGLPTRTSKQPVVRLTPGQTASAIVEGTDFPVGNQSLCPLLSGLLVTPPKDSTSVKVADTHPDCTVPEVHPVVAGDTGWDHR